MKLLLLFLLFLSLFSCTITPGDTTGSDTTSVSKEDLEKKENIEVNITSAKFVDDGVQKGILIEWTAMENILEYVVYFESGYKISYNSENVEVDSEETSYLIDESDLLGPTYTIAVTAVTSGYETGLGNKKVVND